MRDRNISFIRKNGRIIPIKRKSLHVKSVENVPTKKLLEAKEHYYSLKDAKGRTKEYSPIEVKTELNKRYNKIMNKADKDYKKGYAAYMKSKANKIKKARESFKMGKFNFYYGKRAYQEFKKDNKGTWITGKKAKIYFRKESNEIPF